MAQAEAMMSALPNPGPPFIPCAGGGKAGREEGREGRKAYLPQLLGMTAANSSTLHSWAGYSCKNSLLSLASLTGGGDKGRPCFTDAVSCLINRTSQSHVLLTHIWLCSVSVTVTLRLFLCLQIIWHFLCREELEKTAVPPLHWLPANASTRLGKNSKEQNSASVADVVSKGVLCSNKSTISPGDPRSPLKMQTRPICGHFNWFGAILIRKELAAVIPSDGRLAVIDCQAEVPWKMHRCSDCFNPPSPHPIKQTPQSPLYSQWRPFLNTRTPLRRIKGNEWNWNEQSPKQCMNHLRLGNFS